MASSTHARRDLVGSLVGMLVFLVGVALLLLTFKNAHAMFSVPPSNPLGLVKNKALDAGLVGNSVTTIIVRILLLLIMGIVSSLITNKGILLYTHSRAAMLHVETHPTPIDAVDAKV